MKKICTVTLNKEIELDEIQLTKDSDGKEVRTIAKIKKQEPHNYFIRVPTRAIEHERELFTASVMAECDRRGILRSLCLQRRYLDDGDILSVEQRKAYEEAKQKSFEKQSEYATLNEKKDKTEEDKKQLEALTNELINILSEVQEFESKLDNALFQHTAENVARNRTAFWYSLMLSYEDLGGDKYKEVFEGKTFEDKLKRYDLIEESGTDFEIELVKKLSLVASLWFFNKAQTQEDFDLLIKLHENQGLIEAVDTVEKSNIEVPVKSPAKVPVEAAPKETGTP